jgi:putative ABC transport system permease protein
MMRFKIAFRNIFRNHNRTVLSVLMIAGAVSGIILFNGFADHILAMLKITTIDNTYNHIQVGTRSYWDMTPGNRRDQLIPDYSKVEDAISSIYGVTMVSGRMSFYGLLSTGDTTISAQGIGYDPEKETHFQQSLKILEGDFLKPREKAEVIVGVGLQKQLSLKVGQTVTALSYTLDGVVNAIDLTVVGVFQVGISEIDAHVFMLPLEAVQSLIDTTSVENLTIRIKNTEDTDKIMGEVESKIHAINPSYHAKSWYELGELYRQVEQFYKVQNRVIETILISLILLGIMNTVGMSVYERTGEIGTVRALGETERSVLLQFTLEGAILGVLGVIFGFAMGTGLSYAVSGLHLSMVLPSTSHPVPILIDRVFSAYFEAALIGFFTSVLATWLPAHRASRISIIEALKKNI